MKTWSAKAMKYLLFVFNLVFVLTGFALFTLGIAIRSSFVEYVTFLDDRYFATPSLLIFVGVFIFFIAFFGCCGAIQENYCMILTFSVLMGVIFIAELVAGVTGYVLSDEASQVLSGKLNESMSLYNKTADVTALWDEVQMDLKCCGTYGFDDWQPILNGSLPISCCGHEMGAIGKWECSAFSKTLYKTPCLDALTEVISSNISKIGFAGLSIALIQIIGIGFACRLAHNIKENYETV